MCDCGTMKITAGNGYKLCQHCDTGCPTANTGCGQCGRYNRAVSRRLNM